MKLINSGFGDGGPWDDQYDAMTGGWQLFMRNLQLHCAHFLGQPATSMLPMAMWSGPVDQVWQRLLSALGIAAPVEAGARVQATTGDAPPLAGTVMATDPSSLALVLDAPCPGTAIIAAEGPGVSVWSYLYGPERDAVVARDTPRWQEWLARHAEET